MYVTCEKRKGNPKVHVEVCRKKCKLTQECKTFKQLVNNSAKKAA